jgi:hypothetical protein
MKALSSDTLHANGVLHLLRQAAAENRSIADVLQIDIRLQHAEPSWAYVILIQK